MDFYCPPFKFNHFDNVYHVVTGTAVFYPYGPYTMYQLRANCLVRACWLTLSSTVNDLAKSHHQERNNLFWE